MADFGERLANTLLQPGIGPGILPFLNKVFVGILLCLACMWWSGTFSYHVYVVLFLVVGLALSVNWFMLELAKVQPAPAAPAAADAAAGTSAAAGGDAAGARAAKKTE
eukprot:tig00021590_g22774.t1